MPLDPLRFPYSNELALPVVGLESEFKVFVDEAEVKPEDVWRSPAGFVDRPLLKRSTKAVQLPTGGALYFDGGVLEVVTPVIELAPQCTGRVVRSLWEQIGFVRGQLDGWQNRTGRQVRLQAYSCHFNVSFELPRSERNRDRTIQKLAVLLAQILPVPVIILGANRRSTGIGVRPRRDRIEITLDFTPDPGLMAATTAMVVGVVREVIEWPSYLLEEARRRGVPTLAGLEPGAHASRKGWAARIEHFPRNPFRGDLDEISWTLTGGRVTSLRQMALETALRFESSIRRWADDFSVRLLFSVLRGETPSLLDLSDRPSAYDDVGRSTKWGTVLPDLDAFRSLQEGVSVTQRRRDDLDASLSPPWRGEPADRRGEPRPGERRMTAPPAPPRQLTRSTYEKVFLHLGARHRLVIDGETLVPVGIRGWYHALFRTSDGTERMISIDQLVEHSSAFQD